jgi:hypothetical protein
MLRKKYIKSHIPVNLKYIEREEKSKHTSQACLSSCTCSATLLGLKLILLLPLYVFYLIWI